jgi:hypothetical protein
MANLSFMEYLNQASPNIRGVVQIITNNSIFLKRLRFIQVPEFMYEYGRQQSLGQIAFRAMNTFYTGTAPVTSPVVELLKIFGGSIPTDRQLVRGPKGASVRASNLAARVRRASLTFDLKVIKGSSASTPLEFDGINARLTIGQAQTINMGGPLTLPALDLALDQTLGSDDQKVIVCNKAIRRQLKKLIIDAAGGAAVADINAPIQSYRGAALEVVDEDGDNNPILTFNESAAGVAPATLDANGNAIASAGSCTSLYVINPSGDEDQQNLRGLVREVDGTMIEQIAYPEINGAVVDAVEAVMGIALHHPRCATRMYGITAEDITQETAAAA